MISSTTLGLYEKFRIGAHCTNNRQTSVKVEVGYIYLIEFVVLNKLACNWQMNK